jgi:hypothetical protein
MMNENQRNFLNELDRLFAKYGINRVRTTEGAGAIMFESNGQSLIVSGYDGDVFEYVSSCIDEYKPPA